MSRTRRTDWQIVCVDWTCTRCGALPGEWCRTTTGRWSSHLHSARHWAQVQWEQAMQA